MPKDEGASLECGDKLRHAKTRCKTGWWKIQSNIVSCMSVMEAEGIELWKMLLSARPNSEFGK